MAKGDETHSAGKPAVRAARRPSVNYTGQVRIAGPGPAPQDLGQYLFALACELARRWRREGQRHGILLLVGGFRERTGRGGRCRIQGMRQLAENPLARRFLRADTPEFADLLARDEAFFGDGAVVVDASGQMLGSRVYVLVDHPEVQIPKGTCSRHLAAASASMRPDMSAAIVVSEETGVVRLFQDGRIASQLDPAAEKADTSASAGLWQVWVGGWRVRPQRDVQGLRNFASKVRREGLRQ